MEYRNWFFIFLFLFNFWLVFKTKPSISKKTCCSLEVRQPAFYLHVPFCPGSSPTLTRVSVTQSLTTRGCCLYPGWGQGASWEGVFWGFIRLTPRACCDVTVIYEMLKRVFNFYCFLLIDFRNINSCMPLPQNGSHRGFKFLTVNPGSVFGSPGRIIVYWNNAICMFVVLPNFCFETILKCNCFF